MRRNREKRPTMGTSGSDAERRPDPADPCVMVIFGAAGDLTRRKLIPALSNLDAGGMLADRFALVGFARNDWNDERLRKVASEEIREWLAKDLAPADWAERVSR